MSIRELPQPGRVAVAYSAGRDSTALLHATACAARETGGLEVLALHVHHGLSSHADAWLAHAEQVCAEWARQGLPVRLLSRRVSVALDAGEGVESAARRARYVALADMAREAGADLILLAHHRRDQAETVLLQALRGAGVKGLAAMPADIERDGLRWVRPWLRHPREAIEAYVDLHGLAFVDDESNGDNRFARNRLRLEVWPALAAAFPQAEVSLAASADRVQDVLPGVEDWAQELVAMLLVRGLEGAAAGPGLDAVRWADLSGAERRVSLAHWYRAWQGRSLSASWLLRLAQEVPGLAFRQQPAQWPDIGLGLYRGVLMALEGGGLAVHPCSLVSAVQGESKGAATATDCSFCVESPGDHVLTSWCGVLRVTPVQAGGVAPSLLRHVFAAGRRGGEQFQAGPGRPPRSLKKQFQTVGVPEWRRSGPLIWSGERLVFVPGLGIDARCLAPAGDVQWGLDWVPDTR